MAQSIQVGISILHPNLHDGEDGDKIQQENARLFTRAMNVYTANIANEFWRVEHRYPVAGGLGHGKLIFQLAIDDISDVAVQPMVTELCQRLFKPDDYYCLDSLRQGQDILFRPASDTGGTGGRRTARYFGGYFAIEMAKNCAAAPKFALIRTQTANIFSRDQTLWFKGGMNTVVSLADCHEWLHDLTGFLAPTAWSSNHPVDDGFTPPSPLEIQTRQYEIILGITRRLIPTSKMDGYDLITTDLTAAELQQAVNDKEDLLTRLAARLDHYVDALCHRLSNGHDAPALVDEVLKTLDCYNTQRGQLYALTNKEAPEHRATRNRWLTGALVVGIATLLVVGWPVVAAVSLSGPAASAIGVAGVAGALGTAGCINEAHHAHLDSKIPDIVHKLGNTVQSMYTFLYIVQWRSYGLNDDDDQLIGFAERMADMFNIQNVMENWNDPEYKEQYVRSDWTSMRRDLYELIARIRSRRQPYQTGAGGGNHDNGEPLYLADHFLHGHPAGFLAMGNLELPDPNLAIKGPLHSPSDSDSLSLVSVDDYSSIHYTSDSD